MENRMFAEMRKAALAQLAGCDPGKLQEKSGISFDESRSEFVLESLGRTVRVHYPDFRTEGAFNEWHELVILHCMIMGDGTPLSGDFITFGDLPQGLVRGGGFDRECERALGRLCKDLTAAGMEMACKALGAKFPGSKADFSAVFYILPRYPIRMNLWFSDEEFPGTGKFLVDKSAPHYLSVEDAVTVGTVLLEALQEVLK